MTFPSILPKLWLFSPQVSYLPWKCRCFRHLYPVFTISLKAVWSQIFTSALTFPHSCFKIFIKMLQCLWARIGKNKNSTKPGSHLFFLGFFFLPNTLLFFAKIATDDAQESFTKAALFSLHTFWIYCWNSLSLNAIKVTHPS